MSYEWGKKEAPISAMLPAWCQLIQHSVVFSGGCCSNNGHILGGFTPYNKRLYWHFGEMYCLHLQGDNWSRWKLKWCSGRIYMGYIQTFEEILTNHSYEWGCLSLTSTHLHISHCWPWKRAIIWTFDTHWLRWRPSPFFSIPHMWLAKIPSRLPMHTSSSQLLK